ncbi:hypothetical protein A2U01_0046502, partial [Trifolium medium]|nr:hypothetical protein [Trifolium medium]
EDVVEEAKKQLWLAGPLIAVLLWATLLPQSLVIVFCAFVHLNITFLAYSNPKSLEINVSNITMNWTDI